MTQHIHPGQSLAVMALSSDDPDRLWAERHAEDCPHCSAALQEGAALLGWVDDFGQAQDVPKVDAAMKARVRAFALGKASPTWPKWALALGTLFSTCFALFGGTAGALAPGLGLECLAYENLTALAPFTVAATLAMRGVIRLEPLSLATVSMGGALIGQILLHTRCDTHATPHLLAFHVLGVVLAATLGFFASQGLVRARA